MVSRYDGYVTMMVIIVLVDRFRFAGNSVNAIYNSFYNL